MQSPRALTYFNSSIHVLWSMLRSERIAHSSDLHERDHLHWVFFHSQYLGTANATWTTIATYAVSIGAKENCRFIVLGRTTTINRDGYYRVKEFPVASELITITGTLGLPQTHWRVYVSDVFDMADDVQYLPQYKLNAIQAGKQVQVLWHGIIQVKDL